MSNRILDVELHTHRCDGHEAEIWVRATAEDVTSTTELRGKVAGPKCQGVTTVEVAYPLRPLPRPDAQSAGLAARVVIPEPNLWEPACPFLYDAVVELWQDGERCDVAQIRGYRLLLQSRPPGQA
jgi:beta-galactosidase/beta-glucuronidase